MLSNCTVSIMYINNYHIVSIITEVDYHVLLFIHRVSKKNIHSHYWL